MAPREPFSRPAQGLLCPLCLSKNYTLVATRDSKRGILQTVYVCGDCKSHFGDVREFGGRGRSKSGNGGAGKS
jgi:transposase-like protein